MKVLLEHMGYDNACYMKIQSLVRLTLLSQRSVHYTLSKFQKLKLITKVKGSIDGDERRNGYVLNIQKIGHNGGAKWL